MRSSPARAMTSQIPLHGDGEYQICRICEVTERQEAESGGEWGLYSLIADLCPATQTVTPLFTKVAASDFAGESCREMRRKPESTDSYRWTA